MERVYKTFALPPNKTNLTNLLRWAEKSFATSCFLNSNDYQTDKYAAYNSILALGERYTCIDDGKDAFALLKEFHDVHHDWIFGFLTYDLKNQLERLTSNNHDGIGMPGMHFFVPEVVIFPQAKSLTIGLLRNYGSFTNHDTVWQDILSFHDNSIPRMDVCIKPRVSKNEYICQLTSIQEHIQMGDIYEMNYCIEFYDDRASVDPLDVYVRLVKQSPTPFSCYYAWDGKYLMCASPERFLRKTGSRLVSQPIKGTIARGATAREDEYLAQTLLNDPKERSENVMIVDLVRNDLSKTAKDGSVQVEELFGVYPFRHVHQMISTIVSELDTSVHPIEALKQAFPMGSMTGAPKVRAMQLIEAYENTQRGLYSGAVGYITPEKDFDFNVVIRSILFNARQNYLSYMVGSAITAGSIAEKEYEECMLKAKGMIQSIDVYLR